jgi:hypothetical protein
MKLFLQISSRSIVHLFGNKYHTYNKMRSLCGFSKFYFARNLGGKQIQKQNIGSLPESTSTILKEEINIINDEEEILFKPSEIPQILENFYKRSKIYHIEASKPKFESLESQQKNYEFLITNTKLLKAFQLEQFIRAIGHYQIPSDNKLLEVFTKFLHYKERKFENAALILYTIAKLNIKNDALQKLCFKNIQEGTSEIWLKSDKKAVIPLIWALSELNISDKSINSRVDEYITKNFKSLNEYV